MFGKIRYNVNICDHPESEITVHLTKACENKCPFCIADVFGDKGYVKPDIKSIEDTILKYKDKAPFISIGGGEPLLYLDEMVELIDFIKENTNLKIYVMTDIPSTVINNKEKFLYILEHSDYFQISIQHYDETIADQIRCHKSSFSHNKFIGELPYKDKISLSINVVDPWLKTKEDIIDTIKCFYEMGYKHFKIVEIKSHPEMFVNIPEVLGIKNKPPFAYGCKQKIDFTKFIDGFDGDVEMKLNCCLLDSQKDKATYRKATIWDLIKSITRPLFSKPHFFGVIYEDGTIYPYWLNKC